MAVEYPCVAPPNGAIEPGRSYQTDRAFCFKRQENWRLIFVRWIESPLLANRGFAKNDRSPLGSRWGVKSLPPPAAGSVSRHFGCKVAVLARSFAPGPRACAHRSGLRLRPPVRHLTAAMPLSPFCWIGRLCTPQQTRDSSIDLLHSLRRLPELLEHLT